MWWWIIKKIRRKKMKRNEILVTVLLTAIVLFAVIGGSLWIISQVSTQPEVVFVPVGVGQQQPQAVVHEQPVIAQPVFTENGYDYAWMPRGINERGEHIADSGVKVPIGMTVAGPAIIKIASGTAVIVYNNQSYTITSNESVLWKYIGDDDFLTANTEYFPKERLIKIDGGLIREPIN